MPGKSCAKTKARYRAAGMKPPEGKGIHTKKFHKMVTEVAKSGGARNPYAVAMKQLGPTKAVRKEHRRSK